MMYTEELAGYPFSASDLRVVCAGYADGLASALEAVSLDFEPSKTHRDSIHSLMDKSLQKAKRHTTYRRVCTIAAVFVLMFGMIMVTNAHARELFIRWVRQIFPNRVMYQFYGEPAEGLNNYRIGWIPEGFELDDQYEFQGIRMYSYRSQDEEFTVSFNSIEDGFILEIEGVKGFKSLPVYINGVKGTYYYDDQSKNLVWITADENVEIDIEGSISYEMMMKIAESIYIAKPRYTVEWIPEGFVLTESEIDDESACYIYENNNQVIIIEFNRIGAYQQTEFSGFEEPIVIDTVINGNEAFIYQDNNSDKVNMTVFDESTGYMIELDTNVGVDLTQKIAESIHLGQYH